MYRKLSLLVIALVIVTSAFVALAQDATQVPTDPASSIQPTAGAITQPTSNPAMGTTQLAEPEFIGDTNQESVQIVTSYLQTRDPMLLAENAEFFDTTTGQPTVGRDPITQMQNDFFGLAFTGPAHWCSLPASLRRTMVGSSWNLTSAAPIRVRSATWPLPTCPFRSRWSVSSMSRTGRL
jgi:hypothetical protein